MTKRTRQFLAGGVMVVMGAFGIGGCSGCFHHLSDDNCDTINSMVSADLCEVPV